MVDFVTMATKIVSDLRRTSLLGDAKVAINDAINEAAKRRFYFNEMHVSFLTVAAQEYYPDLGLVELDAVWYTAGPTRYDVDVVSQLEMDALSFSTATGGPLQSISRYGGQLRLYPIPSGVVTVYVDGYGKLLPNPLVDDTDTNAWLDDAEQYIRALGKRNLLRDVVRDYGEARVLEAVAEDYEQKLIEVSAEKMATGRLRSTQF